jgi:hypothetical protein
LGLSLLPSLGAVISTNIATHAICSHRAENAADDFAIGHCSRTQLEKGSAFFEKMKNHQKSFSLNFLKKIIVRVLHPSIDLRIAKIQRKFGSS